MEEVYEEDPHDHQCEMHWLDDRLEEVHLTRDEYSKSLDAINNFEKDKKQFRVTPLQYQKLYNSLMAEIQRKYDLRPRGATSKPVGSPSAKIFPPNKNVIKPTTVAEPIHIPTIFPTQNKLDVRVQGTKAHPEQKDS